MTLHVEKIFYNHTKFCLLVYACGSSCVDAVGIVAQHQHAGAVSQHCVVVIVYFAVASRAHPYETVSVTVTVVSLHQCESAFCHLWIGVGFELLSADRARGFHAGRARVA